MSKLVDEMQDKAKEAKLPRGKFIEFRDQGRPYISINFIPDGESFDIQDAGVFTPKMLLELKDKKGKPIYQTQEDAWFACVKMATICADALNEALDEEKNE